MCADFWKGANLHFMNNLHSSKYGAAKPTLPLSCAKTPKFWLHVTLFSCSRLFVATTLIKTQLTQFLSLAQCVSIQIYQQQLCTIYFFFLLSLLRLLGVCAKARLPVLLLLVLLSQHCFYAQFVHGPKSYVKQSPGSASKRRNSCKCIINYYMNYFLKVRRKEKVCLCLRGEVRGRRRRQAQRRRLTRESDEGNEHWWSEGAVDVERQKAHTTNLHIALPSPHNPLLRPTPGDFLLLLLLRHLLRSMQPWVPSESDLTLEPQ